VEIVNSDLIEDKQYALMGSNPANRVKALLEKLNSVMRIEERGYNPNKELKRTSNTYVRRVEKIFKNLIKPLEWLSFSHHDLPILLLDISEGVQKLAILALCFFDGPPHVKLFNYQRIVPKFPFDSESECLSRVSKSTGCFHRSRVLGLMISPLE
jgi:hypothetical protein